ncbi:MAG: cell division protein FtsW [Candidatus Synoicihabitans palmerolidicus]|nr:cell division protein FtsW [Candidatus Synoicihabitans palmerolidicus]
MVVCVIGLLIVGLPVLFSATASFEQGPFYYLTKQAIGMVGAMIACWVVSLIDMEDARRWAWVVGIGAAAALVLTVIPGVGISINGSRRWLGVGSFKLQASEFTKLAMVFCLAHYLAMNQTRIGEFKRGFMWPLGIMASFAGLILLQSDFGTAALTLAVGLILLFLAGAKWYYIVPTVGAAMAGFSVLVVRNPNRLERFTTFLDVEGNKLGGTYQLYQSLAAFAVGGVNGAGIGQGRQQINFLPEAHTDFIFAVMGEEMGLKFTLGVVVTFLVIFLLGLLHLRRAPNLFQFLLVAGAILLITLQAIINLGVVTGLLPTKGMSLPFISAGLSNLLLMGLLMGVVLNSARTWAKPGLERRRRTMEEVTT